MPHSPPNPAPRVPWLLSASLIVIVAAALVGMFFFLRDNGPPGPPQGGKTENKNKKLTRDESLELLALRNRALGHLENHEFRLAEPLLLEIIRRLPDDLFGPRNLTICRETEIETLDPQKVEQRTAALKRAREAADQLNLIETNSHVALVLAARVAVREGDNKRAEIALRRATELAPKSAPVWYELYQLNPTAPGEPPAKETVDALRKAYELEPDNLFVLKDWLVMQVQLKEPGTADTVAAAKQTIAPFVDVIKTNTRLDVEVLLDKLAQAITDEQWPVAVSTSFTVRNLIVSESARDDRYVRLNSLEYLLPDYGPSFYERADLPLATSDRVLPVKFVSVAARSVTIPAGARDVVPVDFDLDVQTDCAALLKDRIVITYPLAPQSADEQPTTITLEIGEGFQGLLAVDLDDDVDRKLQEKLRQGLVSGLADPDLIAFGPAGIKLFENLQQAGDTQREFREKPVGEAMAELRDVRAVVPADLDLDGDLDLLTIASRRIQMWSNRGNWSFAEITARSQLFPDNFFPMAAVVVDWDRDTDVDILVAGAAGFGLLENLRHGRFRWRNLEGDFANLKGSNSLLVEDIGGNGSWSVIGAGANGVHAVLTQTTIAGVVSSRRAIRVIETPVDKALSWDFDNDGVRDLVVLADASVTCWRGFSNGEFAPSHGFGPLRLGEDRPLGVPKRMLDQFSADGARGDPRDITAVAICDVDRDGDEDLLVGSAAESGWRSNDGGNANGWLDVTLVAEQVKPNEQNYSKRVNYSGIGSTIEVKTGSGYQARVVRGTVTHIGLGPNTNANVMRVLWTNGVPQNRVSPAANQVIYEEQKLIGSCPYLYTWDGTQFVFFTDLMWNAPLGLKFAEDVVAPWREWEYLKVDGDKLRAKDGLYQLRVTAELWEIEYFDEIKLFAIDHPAGTEIFTNEKVGPPSLAEHKIHTVSTPHRPVAAKDTRGRDVLDQVIARDGIYTKTYDRKIAQGLTTEHFLELDLGEWRRAVNDTPPGNTNPKRERGNDAEDPATKPPVVTLFLTGWMYPGCTSLSVQHSQNPDQAKPRPPALHAVDSQGRWREVRPFMGFPGGKTKTIAVDISDVFAADSTDHRLRIVTNMEFYWDAAFFTVDDRPVEFRQMELPLVTANLRDRGGVSLRTWPATGNGPELFDYQQLVAGDMWPPIAGAFTRFGDVLPLLTTRDDHLVVMHPGDEIELAFAVPPAPLPAGWVRDFVLYNVGWDKDCDMNTVYGETSEPLPFRDMTAYAHRDGAARPMDEAYMRYLKTYQTRTRARGPFWNELRR